MSVMLKVKSVCGDTSASISANDVDNNPEGIICCANCQLIVKTRQSWYAKYNYNPKGN